MIFDLNNLKDLEKNYDVVIVGSGPAGISCALKFLNRNLRVAILEGGGEFYSRESMNILNGKVVGDKYFDLRAARQRFFGGASNHWGGWCRPLDEHDFIKKSHHDLAYWPIEKSDIDSYLVEASEILEIPNVYEDEVLDENFGIKKISFNFSTPVRFGQKYKSIFLAENLDLFLNANLVDLSRSMSEIKSATFKSFKGSILKIRSKSFVLAAGGIENSRLMLAINKKNSNKIFNESMPIGKFWMEHPRVFVGESIIPTGWANKYLSLTPEIQNKLGILNCQIRFEGQLSDGSLKNRIKDLACYAPETAKHLWELMEKKLVCGIKTDAIWEQEPNINNKITLSTSDVDTFGMPRPILNFKKTDFDKSTVLKTIQQVARYGNHNGYGRIKIFDYISNLGNFPANAEYHHMGGTRMATNNQLGVVDQDLKVHGLNNFFILGSSVFPSGGFANPTLTIVQLSLRLADHLNFIHKT